MNPFKRVHTNGREVNGEKYIIETFPNWPSDNKTKCSDCGEIIDVFIRVYRPSRNFTVYHKIVCSSCCLDKYSLIPDFTSEVGMTSVEDKLAYYMSLAEIKQARIEKLENKYFRTCLTVNILLSNTMEEPHLYLEHNMFDGSGGVYYTKESIETFFEQYPLCEHSILRARLNEDNEIELLFKGTVPHEYIRTRFHVALPDGAATFMVRENKK
jgi:hypothetical protein